MKRRKRVYTDRTKRALVNRHRRSGLTFRDFCNKEDVPQSTLHTWYKNYSVKKPKFGAVAANRKSKPTSESYELVLKDGTKLMIPSSESPKRIKELLEVFAEG